MRLPRLDVNQNSRNGCQSILAARSVLNLVSGVARPVAGSILTISGGFVALSQTAAILGAVVMAAKATCRPPSVPLVIVPTSCSLPPAAGARNRRWWPASSARKKTVRLSGAIVYAPTEWSAPPATTRIAAPLLDGQDTATSRRLLNVRSFVGVMMA